MLGDILKKGIEMDAADIILSSSNFPCLKLYGNIIFLKEYGILDKNILEKELFQIINTKKKELFLRNLELDFGTTAFETRLRVNIFIQKDGISAVFRVIKGKIPEFKELGLPNTLIKFINKKSGLILITGSVGSGKSTTLGSLINNININHSKHIITVEDPIEFIFKNNKSLIEQREVGESTLSFKNGLQYALRQAPDIIMVGEMRDIESFRLALRAAETGNLVLATLHTSGAVNTISRIIDMFPGDEKNQIKSQLAESLIGVVWQELIEKKGGGRIATSEILTNNISMSNMIRENKLSQMNSVIETGIKDGMVTMKISLEHLLSKGLISEETFKSNSIRLIKK